MTSGAPSSRRRIYWDSGCFICFLNQSELERRAICEDILRNAQKGNVILYTSTFTITEVIYPKRSSLPGARRLTTLEVEQISNMFRWRWLKKINNDQRVAFRAVELARDYGLLPGDAIHAASAILVQVDALQAWDRDFSRVAHLVNVEEPSRMSVQSSFDDILARIGPHPDDFAPQQPS